MPEIRASNKLSMQFVELKLEELVKADVLFVEGYFLIERWDIVQFLINQFKKAGKKVAFTLSAVFMVEYHYDKVNEVVNSSDIVFGNEEEYATLAKKFGFEPKDDKENI